MSSAELGDPLSAPFWAGAAKGLLLLQTCSGCRRAQHYPRPFCLSCGADRLAWVPASGVATVYSRTVVRIPVAPELSPPYMVLLVDLAEGPRMLAVAPGDVGLLIGATVNLSWRITSAPVPLLTAEASGA